MTIGKITPSVALKPLRGEWFADQMEMVIKTPQRVEELNAERYQYSTLNFPSTILVACATSISEIGVKVTRRVIHATPIAFPIKHTGSFHKFFLPSVGSCAAIPVNNFSSKVIISNIPNANKNPPISLPNNPGIKLLAIKDAQPPIPITIPAKKAKISNSKQDFFVITYHHTFNLTLLYHKQKIFSIILIGKKYFFRQFSQEFFVIVCS